MDKGAKKEVVCKQCGKTALTSRSSRGLFCSSECSRKWHSGPNSPMWKGGYKDIVCPQCGKKKKVRVIISKKRRQGIFCSRECFNKWYSGPKNPSWKGGDKFFDCLVCGKPSVSERSKNGKFCSTVCASKYRSGPNNNMWNGGKEKFTCLQCKKVFERHKGTHPERTHKFCSPECFNKWERGPNSTAWKGGISFEPYCFKFNKDLKQRVRAWFEHLCVICGKTQALNKRRLHVHHVEYNKQACCDGEPVHFAALCDECHGRTCHEKDRWEAMLHVIIHEIYHDRSYYTKDEWAILHPSKPCH